jgi:hypothetical protein
VSGSQFWQHRAGWEIGIDGMSNICELLINVVKYYKPKVPEGLNQKIKGKVKGFYVHLTQSIIPSAERQALTHLIELAEHGKPN